MSEKQRRILRLAEVKQRTGRPTSSIYADIAAHTFPGPIPLGAKAVGWLESEVDAWITERIAERDLGIANARRSLPLAGQRRKMEASPKKTTPSSKKSSPLTGKSKSSLDLSDTSDRREGRRVRRGGQRET